MLCCICLDPGRNSPLESLGAVARGGGGGGGGGLMKMLAIPDHIIQARRTI